VHPAWPWPSRADHVAGQERQHLAAKVVEAQRAWCSIEPNRFQVPQQGVHRRCPPAGNPAHGVTDPDRSAGVPSGETLFLGHRSINPPVRRR
jgi:hypothetical protein